ncbi:phospholipase D family protein [uncultured Castellaniella sp.]|uniref:phospholipase D family protein n=1 Tax=uncultured Castellaniella sp. TaxID=647907 RepID=UPI00262946DA|nr:phospholipase D family protein [uncultured Castellaniella sp.]
MSPAPWALAAALLLAGCASLPKDVQRPVSAALDHPEATALGQLAARKRPDAIRDDLSGFALLASPNMAYAGRLALTEQAGKTLDIQYYAIHVDPTVRSLLRAVRAAARRGVRVRILLDDFNSVGRDAQVMRMAGVPGVQMRMFNPLPGSRSAGLWRALGSLHDFQRIQHRMHNKLYVADNAWGIIGGRNLGDAYFGTATGSDFIDMDVLAAGPVVQRISASFDRYWNSPLAYPVGSLITPAELKRLRDANRPEPADGEVEAAPPAKEAPALPPALDLAALPLTWAPAGLLVDSPLKLMPAEDGAPVEGAVIEGLLSLLGTARHDVMIVSPYFVPGPQMMSLFTELKARGVRLRVLTNSLASTDALLAQIGYARHRKELLRLGLELYETRAQARTRLRDTVLGSESKATRASLHTKLVIVDGRILSIGSMNLDLRSKLQNSEIALVIRSPALARQAAEQVQDVIDAAAWKVELTPDDALRWHAPPETRPLVVGHDPDTSLWLRFLAKLLAPLTPDEML